MLINLIKFKMKEGETHCNIEQVKALIRAHFDSNEEKFRTVVLQIAAHEAKVGHTESAREIEDKIKRIINEYQKKEILRKNGLMNRSKILLAGDPGTGKTMTASVIANEPYLPLYVIQFDKLIAKYIGETSVKLSKVFDQIKEIRSVYLFDEFDAIGSVRNSDGGS